MSKYFTEHETKGLEPLLVNMLNVARESAGVPFVITSGYRDPEQNAKVGGVKESSHTKGLAVDLRAPNDEYGKRVAFGLGRAGFRRIGIYDKHIHVDISKDLPPATWQGESH